LTVDWLGGGIVRIADLKKQARLLEQGGDAAAALTMYDEILGELERLALRPEGALYVKVGDLSLKTGQRSRAVSLFELAAEEFAREGSHKAVAALCLKILRTNPRRKDAHVRFAKRLFENGHIEAARLVLLDYAERTGLEKTLTTLRSLSERSATEQKAKLEKFFAMADRANTRSDERPAVTTSRPSVSMSETTEHLAMMAQPLAEEPTEPETVEQPVVEEPVLAAPAPPVESDPMVAAIMRSKSAANIDEPEPVEPESDRQVNHVAALSVVDDGQAAEDERKESSFDRIRQALKSRRFWPAAAAAVVVLGIGLMGFGAVPFGGDLDADEPETMAPVPVATAAVLGAPMMDTTAADDSIVVIEVQDSATIEGPVMQSEPVLNEAATLPAAASAERATPSAAPAAPTQLAGLDSNALAAANQAAVEVEVTARSLDDDIADAGRIEIPISSPTRAMTPRAAPAPANRLVVAIDGLEIVGMAGSGDNYRLVQHLESGESVAITVVPFADAPGGENGQIAVQAGTGDSVIGTRRFYDFFVTVEAEIKQSVMEKLLDNLKERNWR
jgi:hypothetical protein